MWIRLISTDLLLHIVVLAWGHDVIVKKIFEVTSKGKSYMLELLKHLLILVAIRAPLPHGCNCCQKRKWQSLVADVSLACICILHMIASRCLFSSSHTLNWVLCNFCACLRCTNTSFPDNWGNANTTGGVVKGAGRKGAVGTHRPAWVCNNN